MTDAAGIRVVAIADADSFVKWSAALLGGVPGLRACVLLVRTPLTASAAQQRTAIAGTGLRAEDVTRIGFAETAGWLEGQRPDVVLLAGRGPFVRLMGRVIDSLTHRPVTVSGLPGMAIPAQRGLSTIDGTPICWWCTRTARSARSPSSANASASRCRRPSRLCRSRGAGHGCCARTVCVSMRSPLDPVASPWRNARSRRSPCGPRRRTSCSLPRRWFPSPTRSGPRSPRRSCAPPRPIRAAASW